MDALVAELARELRVAGLTVDAGSLVCCVRAWSTLDPITSGGLYWGARQTLVHSVEELRSFDDGFVRFLGADPAAEPPSRLLVASRDVDRREGGVVASRGEALGRRDVATCDEAELRAVHRAISLLRFRPPSRRAGAWTAGARGAIDLRAAVRRAARTGGELVALPRHHRRPRPRPVVFVVDVSASMGPYADLLVRTAYVAVRSLRAEAFTMGTRLTRVTAALDTASVADALERVAASVQDRRGGTRLGESLRRLCDEWGPRSAVRGAVVVIGSDGWERDDPGELSTQMARLARQANRVIWVSPHVARDGFAPTAAGIAAALPFCDELVDGSSLTAIEALVAGIAARL